MNKLEAFDMKVFSGWIEKYFTEVINALEVYSGSKNINVANIIEKKNSIGKYKYLFFMNIKEIKGNLINDKYSFFYLAMKEEGFEKISRFFCNANQISNYSNDIRISAVKESCNRIGARLLKFINAEGCTFDIGTPRFSSWMKTINQ